MDTEPTTAPDGVSEADWQATLADMFEDNDWLGVADASVERALESHAQLHMRLADDSNSDAYELAYCGDPYGEALRRAAAALGEARKERE